MSAILATSAATLRKLPIGIQDFPSLKEDDYLYVDKTEYIYNLVNTGKYYFLSRPRRFGKSLLTSTMAAYWEGRKELFTNLKIAKLEPSSNETPHPVFYFDFNGVNYQEGNSALENKLNSLLTDWEAIYGNEFHERQLGERFCKLLQLACEKTGQKAVVLVDEYDKPLLDVLDESELEKHNKAVFKGFFSVLKEADKYLRFVFITGVTKFEKVSIFSDLNQLRDISFSKEYAGICGITEQEIHTNFLPEIETLASEQDLSIDECFARIKKTYDGYHFHQNGVGVYNPFSLLNAFADREFRSYWFSTGTPTFLVNKIVKNAFEVRKLSDKTLYADEQRLSDYRANNSDLVPLLYQTGYLTLVGYDEKRRRYTLGFPNEEVKYGMLNSLLPAYAPKVIEGTGMDIFSLDECLEEGDLDRIKNIFTGLFASIPYSSAGAKVGVNASLKGGTKESDPFENYFQAVIYIIFTLIGQFVICETHMVTGRIDCIVKTSRFIYIFEFKRDGTVDEALKQIYEKGYELPFLADERKLYKIGVVFDSKKRTLKDWKVAE